MGLIWLAIVIKTAPKITVITIIIYQEYFLCQQIFFHSIISQVSFALLWSCKKAFKDISPTNFSPYMILIPQMYCISVYVLYIHFYAYKEQDFFSPAKQQF